MSGELSTWQKGKDAALIGFLGLIGLLVMQVLRDVAELKTQIAVYQANLAALKDDHASLKAQVDTHLREDRERFQRLDRR